MVNIEKHISHWRNGAEEDLDVANQLIESGKIRHGLFFLHLALEKLLKAHICRHTKDIAPRLHNLVRLAELSGISFEEAQILFFAEMNPFNMEGRYPELWGEVPTKEEASALQQTTKDLFIWLKKQL
jgi:HEPN domain-containing protein